MKASRRWDPQAWICVLVEKSFQTELVGGFNPPEKYDRQIGFLFPK